MIISISGRINSGKDLVGLIIRCLTSDFEVPLLECLSDPLFSKDPQGYLEQYPKSMDWEVKKFADKLKDMVCLLIGCTREQLEDQEFKEKELGEEWWYFKRVRSKNGDNFNYDLLNYTEHKEIYGKDTHQLNKLTPRLLLQLLGTEVGRNTIHPNIWVNALISEYKGVETTFIDQNLPIQPSGDSFLGVSEDDEVRHGRIDLLYPNWIITDTRFPNELQAVKDRGGITIRVNRAYHKGDLVYNNDGTVDLHPSETALDDAEFDYIIDNNGTIEELIEQVKAILIKENIL